MRVIVALCLFAFASSTMGQGVLINEVNTSTAAWIEIVNFDVVPRDISGWTTIGYWDNSTPGLATWNFTFPGAPNSGTTVLAPGQFAFIGESALFPTTPGGVLRFTHAGAVPWSSGVSGSLSLLDGGGNVIDAVLWGNTNLDQAGATAAGEWFGLAEPVYVDLSTGSPVLSGAATSNTANYRHSRTDSDTGLDWTNFGANGTPGSLNPFQLPGTGAQAAPVASFVASTVCGPSPHEVQFTNTSQGTATLSAVTWDFASTSMPGTSTTSTHHAAWTFTTVETVTLTIVDSNGNMSTTTPLTITPTTTGTVTPVTTCGRESFENFPALVADPCGGSPTPNPITGYEYRALEPGARMRIVDGSTLAALPYNWPVISPIAGPTAVILDSISGTTNATNKFVLHLNGLAINGGNGFRIRYWLQESADETHAGDYVGLSDGVTPGPGTTNTGAPNTLPGLDGYRETLLNDWNSPSININHVWMQFTHNVDSAFLAARGLVMSSDMRLIFSQTDNASFEGNDGLAIDYIEILPLTTTPGPGQAANPAAALFDINDSENANCSLVGDVADPNGPFFAEASVGGTLRFRFQGQPNQAVVLVAGPLSPGLYTLPIPGAGTFDCGIPNPMPPFLPTLQIIVDGSQPSFLSSLFNTGPGGSNVFSIGTPLLPPGILSTFQAVVFNTNTVIAVSNAVQLTII